MMHELKTLPRWYKLVESGIKTWEIRLNDRDFKEGDILLLKEYDAAGKRYTGIELTRLVTYVAKDLPWLQEGYVCMSIK